MTEIQLLLRQTEDAYNWTNKLIDAIPFDKWDRIPGTLESSITWQVGHLIISHYFHSVMVISGHQKDIIQRMPLKVYSELFTDAGAEKSIGKTSPQDLLDHLKIIQQKSLSIIAALPANELDNILEPTPVAHPIAKNKLEAIDWNCKHTMYHCGQIGILRRIIHQRFDFGLRVN